MIAADYLIPPGRYIICIVSEEPHWRGLAGQIVGGEHHTVEAAFRALDRITSDSLRAAGRGTTKPLGSCVVGVFDQLEGKWL